MPLSRSRHQLGTSPHEWEMRALDFLVQNLPDKDPYHLWGLVELVEPSGRRYEIDAVVLTPRALFLVEIKSHPAHFSGDSVDWTVRWKDGRPPLVLQNPVPLTNLKAKVLAGALERRLGNADRPHVQALVFLSDPDASIESKNNADHCVVTRHNVLKALTEGSFPGANERLKTQVIDRPRGARIVDAVHKLGLRPSVELRRVAGYVLGELLDEGPGWQDYEARSEQVASRVARARVYAVPQASSLERREQLARAAQREAEILNALSDHPHIVHMQTSTLDGPGSAPCLLFDRRAEEETLDAFLRRNPDLSFERRVEIIEQVGNALAFCHRRGIIHRGVDPSAVLVRRDGETPAPATGPDDRSLVVQLFNFQLAAQEGVSSGTHHLSAFSPDRNLVYRAPEVLQDPRHASTASDVFSLGALAFRVLTGRSPGANLAERNALLGPGHLSLRAVRDDFALAPSRDPRSAPEALTLDDVIAEATRVDPLAREHSAAVFVELFLETVTRPTPNEKDDPDPFEARPGDTLGGGLRVVKYLGSGATAKVFRVERDGVRYALKVALDAEHEQRLRQEADILAGLRNDRIVALRERLTLGRRFALLLDDAGESLAELLAREGPQSLDYARRWGEDLFLALEHLEEKSVQHRDIKSANLGVLEPESKRRRHLLLFDFSLSAGDPQQVTAGTPAYRDPFLATRGRWDDQADRYAAAVVLYELLTGVRPQWGDGDGPVRPNDTLGLHAERFDAAVRDRLAEFFHKALARDVSDRFPSAEAMRHAWNLCFVLPPVSLVPDAPPPRGMSLADVRPDTPLEALGLSVRARNALDRSGIVTASQLARVPDNLLSSIRGIGRDTAREIQAFRRNLRDAPGLAAADEPEFDSSFNGEDIALSATGVPAELAQALIDGGIHGLVDLARAPRSQVERLARVGGVDATPILRAVLEEAFNASERTRDPRTVEAWLDALFNPRQRHPGQRANYVQLVWRWLGLDPSVPIEPGDTLGLAARLGCTRQNVSIMLGRAREKWATHPHVGRLVGAVREVLDTLRGVARIDRLAEAFAMSLPHDAGMTDDPLAGRRVEALVSVASMLDESVVVERIHGRRWLLRDRATVPALRALGHAADDLAEEVPLPSVAEVQKALDAVAAGTALAAFAFDRRVDLAADASKHAARSARLELYPRGMDARRALELCHAAVVVEREGVTEAQLRAVVTARYPFASALPERPSLDALVADVLGLEWNDDARAWRRPVKHDETPSSLRSEGSVAVLSTAVHAARPARPSAEAQEAWEFDDALRVAARRRDWRVFTVAPSHGPTVLARIAERLGTRERSLDAELLAESDALMRERGIREEVVLAADREGPAGRDWARLKLLARDAADRLAKRWTREPGPLVVGDLGLAARYGLGALLQSLLDATRRDDGPAVFLVVPRYAESAGVAVDGGALPALPLPTYSPAQVVSVPVHWIKNVHRGEEA